MGYLAKDNKIQDATIGKVRKSQKKATMNHLCPPGSQCNCCTSASKPWFAKQVELNPQ